MWTRRNTTFQASFYTDYFHAWLQYITSVVSKLWLTDYPCLHMACFSKVHDYQQKIWGSTSVHYPNCLETTTLLVGRPAYINRIHSKSTKKKKKRLWIFKSKEGLLFASLNRKRWQFLTTTEKKILKAVNRYYIWPSPDGPRFWPRSKQDQHHRIHVAFPSFTDALLTLNGWPDCYGMTHNFTGARCNVPEKKVKGNKVLSKSTG